MHGEEPGGVVHGEFASGPGFDMEMGCARVFFVKRYRKGEGAGLDWVIGCVATDLRINFTCNSSDSASLVGTKRSCSRLDLR